MTNILGQETDRMRLPTPPTDAAPPEEGQQQQQEQQQERKRLTGDIIEALGDSETTWRGRAQRQGLRRW